MVIIMFVGGFMWAYIIGAVCAVTATLDIKIEHQQLYDQINSMLVDMSIDRSIYRSSGAVSCSRARRWKEGTRTRELVEFLSPELQGLMCDEISARTLGKVNYFEQD